MTPEQTKPFEDIIRDLMDENTRLRSALRKLIDEINNRDDLPTEEYEEILKNAIRP